MGALGDLFGGLLKPLLVALLFLVALGLFSSNPGTGTGGAAGGLECGGITSSPELNRLICRYHPAKIWNTPVNELFPFLSAAESAGATR
jgi:hypothetical protein